MGLLTPARGLAVPATARMQIELARDLVEAHSYVTLDARTRRPVRVTLFGNSVTVRNVGSTSLFMEMCGREPTWVLEKREPQGWMRAYAPLQGARYVTPLELVPGASYTGCVTVYSALDSQTELESVGVFGEYRVRYGIFRHWSGGCPGAFDELLGALPAEATVSGCFLVTPGGRQYPEAA